MSPGKLLRDENGAGMLVVAAAVMATDARCRRVTFIKIASGHSDSLAIDFVLDASDWTDVDSQRGTR